MSSQQLSSQPHSGEYRQRAIDSRASAPISGWALLWKEFRQVMPLILTVLGLGFGVLLMILVSSAFSSQRLKVEHGYWFLFLAMPMMYATGVGILLVGTEKESRSLTWIRSLPISGTQIA